MLNRSSLAAWAGSRRRSAGDGLALAKQAVRNGRPKEAIQALEKAVALEPERREALHELHKLLVVAGRFEEAEPHIAALARLQPEDAMTWRRLAVCRRTLGQTVPEAEALGRVIALEPGDEKIPVRLLQLAIAAETDEGSCAVLAALPDSLVSTDTESNRRSVGLRAVARRLALLGRTEAARVAWSRLLAWDPTNLEAVTQVEEAGLYDARAPRLAPSARPKLLVLGNCQAYGVARRLRLACPDLEVRTIGLVEITDAETRAALFARHADARWIATQPLNDSHGPLASAALEVEGRVVIRFPRVHFRGLHPDLLRSDVELGGLGLRGYHSAIVLAAYAMDLPQTRAAELFNAYVYALLGYFDAYPKAEAHLFGEGLRCGMDIESAHAAWMDEGPFMHVPNHPRPIVLDWLARKVAERLAVEMRAPDPEPSDIMAPFGSWPVYPEIARRLGLAGSMTFHPGRGRQALDLEGLLAHGYKTYARFPRELILGRLGPVVETLRREGV